MKKKVNLSFVALIMWSLIHDVFSFEILSSQVLGSYGQNRSIVKDSDPLKYIFDQKTKSKFSRVNSNEKKIVYYFALFNEGENLKRSCSKEKDLLYRNADSEIKVKRTIMANLQYIGLDLTVRAIAEYAKQLDYSLDEYKNLMRRLIVNNCSLNLTVISIRQLTNNLLQKFLKPSSFKLPSVSLNPSLPKKN